MDANNYQPLTCEEVTRALHAQEDNQQLIESLNAAASRALGDYFVRCEDGRYYAKERSVREDTEIEYTLYDVKSVKAEIGRDKVLLDLEDQEIKVPFVFDDDRYYQKRKQVTGINFGNGRILPAVFVQDSYPSRGAMAIRPALFGISRLNPSGFTFVRHGDGWQLSDNRFEITSCKDASRMKREIIAETPPENPE